MESIKILRQWLEYICLGLFYGSLIETRRSHQMAQNSPYHRNTSCDKKGNSNHMRIEISRKKEEKLAK